MSELDKIRHAPEVHKVEELCADRYAVRYHDGSATLVNGQGETIPSPLQKLDFIQNVRRIGTLQGMPHFAYKGCDWATRNQPEIGMFDYAGHAKAFRDPRLAGLETLEELQHEFNQLVIKSNDPSNPRRNDPMLLDLDQKQTLSQHM